MTPAKMSSRGWRDQRVDIALREVAEGDAGIYERMFCDAAMMSDLGGPLPRGGIDAKLQHDIDEAAAGRAWIYMIQPCAGESTLTGGNVVLWAYESHGESISEIGWMVLPEFQGRGIGKAAVRLLLRRAREGRRWGVVHAYPGIANTASNAICRSLGFTLAGRHDAVFAGRSLLTNHWHIDPIDLA
jgi:RimJ/RimL family protein N-acetyltransferase